MQTINYHDAVPVTRDIYWIGFFDEQHQLHCNPYLLVEEKEAIIFDPGSIPDFPEIMRKVIDIVNPNDISHVVVHHQDPDVCGNLAVTEDIIERDNLKIVANRHTVRLIRHLGLKSDYYRIDEHDYQLTLQSGRRLEFMNTPYLHSPGAFVTYDTKTKSLFTSDLFGGVAGDWDLFADDWDFLSAMKKWHQIYMPSNAILKHRLEIIEKRWDINRILPQHGCILEGDNISKAFEFLKALPCGLDLEVS
ncbi:MAG: MBL fold metallo-hydrolase [Mariprofundaceae bacterium]